MCSFLRASSMQTNPTNTWWRIKIIDLYKHANIWKKTGCNNNLYFWYQHGARRELHVVPILYLILLAKSRVDLKLQMYAMIQIRAHSELTFMTGTPKTNKSYVTMHTLPSQVTIAMRSSKPLNWWTSVLPTAQRTQCGSISFMWLY